MIKITLIGEVNENGEFQEINYDLVGTQIFNMFRGDRIRPGYFAAENSWVETDLTERHPVIQAFAKWFWTEERVEAAKKAFPWVPPPPITLPDLEKWKFWAILDIHNLAEPIKAAIAALPDPTTRAVVQAKFEHNLTYNRYDPIFQDEALLKALNLTPEAIDALWEQGLALGKEQANGAAEV